MTLAGEALCFVWQEVMQQVLGVLRQLLRKLDIEGDKDVAFLTRLLRQGQPVTWTQDIIIILSLF